MDHGGNPDNGKFTGGYVVNIGSGAVSWSSKLQPLVALSTTEAEHICRERGLDAPVIPSSGGCSSVHEGAI